MDFYRTGKGSHRHADIYCANSRRSIFTGDPIVIPADEVKDWAPCRFCCETTCPTHPQASGREGDEKYHSDARCLTAPESAKGDDMCRNSGVTNPRRMRSTCTDCGKEGAVNPKTGTLRAHKRAS